MGALVESCRHIVLGGRGPGDVRHGRRDRHPHPVASTLPTNRNNLFVVAVSLGFGMIPLVAPDFKHVDAARASTR
jgi:NCS2 family nucleobase:cation symporter-2